MRSELQSVVDELTQCIDAFKESCKPGSSQGWPSGLDPLKALDSNGRPVLADMLTAKANAMAALARLP